MLDKLRNASYALSMTFIWGAQPEGTRTWGQVHKYLCEANAQARRLQFVWGDQKEQFDD